MTNAPSSARQHPSDALAAPGERISGNTIDQPTKISICIPAWQDDAHPLLAALAKLEDHEICEILVYDDGSANAEITRSIEADLARFTGPARLITAAANHGRSHARNRLIAHARSDWLLLLDADMLPDHKGFLSDYLNAITRHTTPALIAGGFSLDQITANNTQALHAAQSRRSECLSADERNVEPGRYVFTSNILVHRAVLETIRFDDGYTGWGWEDVDWGLRVADAFPVVHLDNTATHLGLDDTAVLLRKYGKSGPNFARLARQHPDAASTMPLYRVANALRRLPGRRLLAKICHMLARDPLGMTPMSARLFALKLYRSAIYSEHLS